VEYEEREDELDIVKFLLVIRGLEELTRLSHVS
jgi:hypothetical protein